MKSYTHQTSADKYLSQFGYQQTLKRSLNVWQLTAFGLNYMIPLSPAIFFGFVLLQSGGTVALPFIIAGIPILFTASSYAIMVRHFPLAGSLYNFVSRSCHPYLGFIAGWIVLLDYLLISTVTAMSAAMYIHETFHIISYETALFLFVILTGSINILGIRLLASLGLFMLLAIDLLVFINFLVLGHSIIQHNHLSGLFSLTPFHFKKINALIGATSLAVASYLGFDAITTLAEEAKHPINDIPKAIFLCVLIGGATMILTGYLGVLAMPQWRMMITKTSWVETALFYISKQTGGVEFALFYSMGFIVSMALFNIVAMAATARLLFGMGRDGVISKNIFAQLNRYWKTPHFNICIIMLISIFLGTFLNLVDIAALVNYGALLGFAILNLAVIYFFITCRKKILKSNKLATIISYIVLPLLGLLTTSWVFYGLQRQTHIVGTIWLILGVVYGFVVKRRLYLPSCVKSI